LKLFTFNNGKMNITYWFGWLYKQGKIIKELRSQSVAVDCIKGVVVSTGFSKKENSLGVLTGQKQVAIIIR